MAMACHAGENAYAALSTVLQGVSYVGTLYGMYLIVTRYRMYLMWGSTLMYWCTLSKSTLRTYPSGRVPTLPAPLHTLSPLAHGNQ